MQNLWRITFVICCVLLVIQQGATAEDVSISTWNLEWVPGHKQTSTQSERATHMIAAKDALSDSQTDILCLQEVRDWESVAELVSVLPGFEPHVVSRFQEFGGISIQQTAVASKWSAEASWAEAFRAHRATSKPPRGFSLAVFRRADVVLLVYSVHFKSNLGGIEKAIAKREEAALQLLLHVFAMEKLYSARARVVTVIGGDFNTDATDPRFAEERTFGLLRQSDSAGRGTAFRSTNASPFQVKAILTRASTASLFAELRSFRRKSFRRTASAITCKSSS